MVFLFYLKFVFNRILLSMKSKEVKIYRKVKSNRNTVLEGSNIIHRSVNCCDSKIGYASYIGNNSILNKCKIGKFTSIAPHVEVIRGRHPTTGFVSTHPAFFSNKKQAGFTYSSISKFDEFKLIDSKYSVVIGSDVWIGSGVKILEGITIGDGAVIGAGAIVTKDVEPYSINVGIPSRVIKHRFSENIINVLLDFEWWNKPVQWIEDHSDMFDDIEAFTNYIVKSNKLGER